MGKSILFKNCTCNMKTRLSGPVLIAFVLVLLYSMVPLVGSKGAAKTTGSFAASAATNSGKNITNVAQAGGTNAGTVKKAAQAGSQQTAKGACFTEGTQIVVGMEFTEDGVFVQYITVNIEDVRVGDWVYSYNTLTGETELAQVTATYSLRSDHINYLTIIDEDGNEQVIETTDAHPFWVVTDEPDRERAARSIVDENGVWLYHDSIGPTENGFWVEAKDLRVGDVFLGANGELSMLTNIVRVEQSGGIGVFNFTVDGNHNYFILAKEYGLGQTSVLVHNAKKWGGGAAYPKDIKNDGAKNISGFFGSEREARNYVFQRLGKKPVNIGDNKIRSADGRWQYRAKPADLAGHPNSIYNGPHIHLERLNPKTGEVIKNFHLYFPRK